jgi:hypothetical protein
MAIQRMNSKIALSVLAGLMAVLLGACTVEVPATEEPGVDDYSGIGTPVAPTSTAQPTVEVTPAANADSSSEDAVAVTFEGGSFAYDASLATDTLSGQVEAVTADLPSEMVAPAYIELLFNGYAEANSLHSPRILLYPVDDLKAVNEQAGGVVDALDRLLTQQPDLPVDGGFEAEPLPFLPLFNAGQYLRTQGQYLDFQNGSGIRYVTQFGQAALPVNNHEVFYTFQGLTDDRSVYVAVILPISHPLLPADSSEQAFNSEDLADFDAYVLDLAQQLNAQSGDSFSPDLASLDALVQSLNVDASPASTN